MSHKAQLLRALIIRVIICWGLFWGLCPPRIKRNHPCLLRLFPEPTTNTLLPLVALYAGPTFKHKAIKNSGQHDKFQQAEFEESPRATPHRAPRQGWQARHLRGPTSEASCWVDRSPLFRRLVGPLSSRRAVAAHWGWGVSCRASHLPRD